MISDLSFNRRGNNSFHYPHHPSFHINLSAFSVLMAPNGDQPEDHVALLNAVQHGDILLLNCWYHNNSDAKSDRGERFQQTRAHYRDYGSGWLIFDRTASGKGLHGARNRAAHQQSIALAH